MPRLRRSGWNVVSSILTVAFVAVSGLFVVAVSLFLLVLALAAVLGQLEGFSTPGLWLVPAFAAIDVVGTWFLLRGLAQIVRRDARFGVRWRRATRLARFAEANGLVYVPELHDPPPAGLVFTAGTRRRVSDLIGGDEGIGFELGNYEYAGRSHEGRLRRYGFLRIDLARRLPHMVLVAHANRRSFGRTNLPWRLPPEQILRMGDPFDQRFTLYCPDRYEDDARYVFTPKLLTFLLERATGFDVEIVDDRLLLYSATPLRMTDPTTYHLLGDLLLTIGSATSERARLYRDRRALRPGRVGPYGRRLRIQVPRMAIVTSAVAVVWLAARIVTLVMGVG